MSGNCRALCTLLMVMCDSMFLRRCLSLAARGRGKVGNGAMVGSVLVQNGEILAEGWHDRFGGPHAERALLENFDQKISADDVLYVSLEPCCHHGKTPPCTDIIIERGIKTVVFGMYDPDRRVMAKGSERLQRAGITMIGPVLPEECARLNRGFVWVRTKNRPWITLKQAQSPDQSIAQPDGSPKKITSRDQDRWSHTFLRARHDAILVGVGTIIADNPTLDCRFAERNDLNQNSDQYQPWRLVLDPHLRIPETAHILTDQKKNRTIIIYCSASAKVDQQKADRLRLSGVRLMSVNMTDSAFDWDHLWAVLTTSSDGFHGLTSILVEGGPKTWRLFQDARVVDEEVSLCGVR